MKGNVTYMAPEQARGLDVDARADLYSLALVLYTLATGRPLYVGDTTYGLLMKAGAGPGVEDRIGDPRRCPTRSRRSSIAPRPRASRIATRTRARWPPRWKARRAAARPRRRRWWCELFGAELKEEAHRMATFSQQDSAASVAGASSG